MYYDEKLFESLLLMLRHQRESLTNGDTEAALHAAEVMIREIEKRICNGQAERW